MAKEAFFIKERDNPQLGIYFVLMGKMPEKDAKKMERSAYGVNSIHRFETFKEYMIKVESLIKQGARVVKQ